MHSDSLPVDKSIVLVGLMGCGKSALGKRLAKRFSVAFIDIDVLIEQQEGCSVSEIFATKGEGYFREQERLVLKRCLNGDPCIISPGGGAFMQPAIRSLLLEQAVVVWIQVSYDILLERVSRKKTRPLLEQGDKATILRELMEVREPVYAEAPIKVMCQNDPHDVSVGKVIDALKQYVRG